MPELPTADMGLWMVNTQSTPARSTRMGPWGGRRYPGSFWVDGSSTRIWSIIAMRIIILSILGHGKRRCRHDALMRPNERVHGTCRLFLARLFIEYARNLIGDLRTKMNLSLGSRDWIMCRGNIYRGSGSEPKRQSSHEWGFVLGYGRYV
ncbi:uncharacterized protein BO80DRAFT_63103 [Aspergillus ibericus CBS 121593]|uniref:Uncharacterized protein n=1 Tax=Aspergillus ibericus CBS 121593 TaxID=1448316 RepID=A0A395H4S5_9EURO|nr:hypothetical protein BO80DRAFT_63103 [Aspergillus ibericus CBS 121593]RAL01224.1 hypothetical protein BO80DRAFT_63103 [Aspergillus ibericus CBS 121593]